MRQLLFLLFLIFGIFESLNGQVEIGVSAGLNISNSTIIDFGLDGRPRRGCFVGIAPSYPINEKIRLTFDLQYSQKGYIIGGINSQFRYSYLEAIPEIEYRPIKYLIFGLGVSYAYRVNEEQKSMSTDWSSTRSLEYIKSFDYGVTGKIKGVYKNIFGFVRYNFGLKNIAGLGFPGPRDFELHNRNIQFGIGCLFDLGEKE